MLREGVSQGGLVQGTEELFLNREGDGAGLLGNDDDQCVGLFGEPDGGAVTGAELAGKFVPRSQRKEARGGHEAVAAKDDGAIMERRARHEGVQPQWQYPAMSGLPSFRW